MIAEISAIVAGVNIASNALKQAAGTANDLSTIGSFLQQLGGAEVELAKAQNQGGLNEADAVKAALARKDIADTMTQVKDAFVISGNGHLYNECMAEMASARKAKQLALAQAVAKKKKRMKEIRDVALVLAACLTFLPLIILGIVSLLLNR